MISRLSIIVAGVLAVISAWLPWVNVMGFSQNGFMGDTSGNPGILFIVMGVIILGMGIIHKKWSAILAILFSVLVCMLGLKYFNDSTSSDAISIGATVGSGVYFMIFSGLIGIIGGIMRFFVKKKVV